MLGGQRATARRPRSWPALAATALVASGLLGPAFAASAAPSFAVPAFRAAWERADQLVAEGRVNRPWLWGPEPIATRQERDDDVRETGLRLTQYFDKGRLDLTQPDAEDVALLSSGALARDLALGLVQVSSTHAQVFDPAFVPVAGDADPAANADAPRYADFSYEVLASLSQGTGGIPSLPSRVGQPITATIQAGARGARPATDQPQALVGAYDPTSGHNIAAPFWDAFNEAGLVLEPATGAERNEPLYDWRLVVGAPLTEPAWTRVSLDGQPTLLLVQLFERRVLTYSPDAPPGWRTQAANTGRHYYDWRYGPAPWRPPLKPMAPAQAGQQPTRFLRTPLTPSTPYQVERWVPPSINGQVAPGAAPGGVMRTLFVRGFTLKDLLNQTATVWITPAGGRATPLRLESLLVAAEDRFDGMVLGIDTLSTPAGVWALTFQSYTDPERHAVLYFRVTNEPREVPIAILRNPRLWAGAGANAADWPPFTPGVEE